MTEPLLTPTELDEFRNGDPVRLIGAATAEVRSYCGWHIAPEVTETVKVDGSGVALLLPTLHLTDVTSITRDGVDVPLADVRWKPNGIVTGYTFSGEYDVTFTHGYDSTPEDVARVVAALASEGMDGLRRLKSWTKGPFSESYDEDSAQSVLDRYRLPSRP
jgi:hypothetical protein